MEEQLMKTVFFLIHPLDALLILRIITLPRIDLHIRPYRSAEAISYDYLHAGVHGKGTAIGGDIGGTAGASAAYASDARKAATPALTGIRY